MGNTLCCSSCQDQKEIVMPEVQSMQDVEALIEYIDQFISRINTEGQGQINKPTSVNSLINYGGNLMEKLSLRLNWHLCKNCLLSALDRETRKVLIDVSKQAQSILWVGMALSVIAHMLERAEQVSSNKDQCMHLLGYMTMLAKHVKNLDSSLERPKLDDILCFIVKGTVMCALKMERNSVCRFISAPLDDADLRSLESQFVHSYQDLNLQALTAVLNRQTEVLEVLESQTEVLERQTQVLDRLPDVPGPSQGEYPDYAVGVEDAQTEVIKQLDMTELSRRAVVIYGIGGIGKTTLATAVYNRLDLKDFDFCRVDVEENLNDNDLPPLQERILRDLFKENLKLVTCAEGRQKLAEAFGKAPKPVFLFIDNALRERDLEKLLPIQHLQRLPMQSRFLVTTRNLNETDIFRSEGGIEVFSHRVDSLLEREAKRLLCRYALGDANNSFDPDVNMDGLLKICGGIPLYLKLVGAQLNRCRNTVSACEDIVSYHDEWQRTGLEGGEDHVREHLVDFVYRQLRGPSKEAFLDIVFFFCYWEENKVGDIVGEVQLQELEAAALVSTFGEEENSSYGVKKTEVKVKVHDIVRARGRTLSEGTRITDSESLSILLGDEQKLQNIKGIWLPQYGGKNIRIEAKHVDLMSRSLLVFKVGYGDRINGRCKGAFKDLRVLEISYEDVFPIDLSKSRQLVYFKSSLEKGNTFPQLSSESLRLLYFLAPSDSHVSLDINGLLAPLRELQLFNITLVNFETCYVQLKDLRSLLLDTCRGFTSIPESFGNLSFLQNLSLKNCSMLERLPDGFGTLSSLKDLDMSSCSKLERLPESFGNLSALIYLDIHSCSKLERLPETFGNLSFMVTLRMNYCSILERLPESFGNLSYLKYLYIIGCSKLERLPDSFGNLSSLQYLNMVGCSKLERLPHSFGNLSSLQDLDMDGCSMLERLPQTFNQLSCLQRLEMNGCEKMCSLSSNFGELKCLKSLNISNCKELKTLPHEIVRSTSLSAVKAYGCTKLEGNAMDSLVEIKSLMFLEMGESPMLIKRWEEIKLLDRPLIGAALRLRLHAYPYKEMMSTLLFNGGSRFLHLDGEGQLAEVASSSFPEVGMKVAFLFTACPLSDEVRHKLLEVASQYQIIYVDVEGETEVEESRWMEEREERIKKRLVQLPEGSRAWTSFPKTTLLFAFSLTIFRWITMFRWKSDISIVGTRVLVDEEGGRKLSPLENIFRTDRHVHLPLFESLLDTLGWMY